MNGLSIFLHAELLQIVDETKRRHPEIKEAAEKSIIVVRSLIEQPDINVSKDLSKHTDFLFPFTLACETKNLKLITISIGCLHKLILHRAVPESSIKTIVKILSDLVLQGVEVQLKILQTIPPLLNNYQSLQGDLLIEALVICFRLQDLKVNVVSNTATATLRQLVINIFDKVLLENETNDKDLINPKLDVKLSLDVNVLSLRRYARDAYYIFQDLCLLSNGEQPILLKLNNLSKILCWELIESILLNYFKLFESHPEFTFLLREHACPLVLKNLTIKYDFSTTMRMLRIVYILLKKFNEILIIECEIYLNMLVKFLEPGYPLWQRVISMEIFHGICTDDELLRNFYFSFDKQNHSTNVYKEMINAFGRLATERPQVLSKCGNLLNRHSYQSMKDNGQKDIGGLNTTCSMMKIKCIDQMDKSDPPQIPEVYLYYLTLLCLNSIVNGLHNFVIKNLTSVIQNQKKISLQSKSQILVADMANTSWPGLLAALSFFLTLNLNDELFHIVLHSYQNFAIVCGFLHLSTPRDAFITFLCKIAIPDINISSSENNAHKSDNENNTKEEELSVRSLSCLKSLLIIAQTIGGVLDDSWYLILETVQLVHYKFFSKRASKKKSRKLNMHLIKSESVTSLPSQITSCSSSSSSLNQTTTPLIVQMTRLSPSVATPSEATPFEATTSEATPFEATPFEITTSEVMPSETTDIYFQLPEHISKTEMPLVSNSGSFKDELNSLKMQIITLVNNCKFLNDVALQFFIRSLCRLNAQACGIELNEDFQIAGQELKLFDDYIHKPVTLNASHVNKSCKKSFAIKVLHSAVILNMHRMIACDPSLIWDLVTSHLIIITNYISIPHHIRIQACEALADIIISAVNYISLSQIKNNERIQSQLLTSLYHMVDNSELTSLRSGNGVYVEIQRIRLETLNKLLETSGRAGYSFTFGWNIILDMIKSVCIYVDSGKTMENDTISDDNLSVLDESMFYISDTKTSDLVLVAFSSLQLICNDFLLLLSPKYLKELIKTLGAFGLQMDDLYISLKSIGLLWNISEFVQIRHSDHNYDIKMIKNFALDTSDIDKVIIRESTSIMDILWMLLLSQLLKVCSDARSEVRNLAIQTIIRSIAVYSPELEIRTLHMCIQKILFSLLDSLKHTPEQNQDLSLTSHKEFDGFLFCQSRNTIDKQWDETKILALTGISKLFKNFMSTLIKFDGFQQLWESLLSQFEYFCLYSNLDISIAAFKAFNMVIQHPFQDKFQSNNKLYKKILLFWQIAWNYWEKIGLGIITTSDQKYFSDIKSSTIHFTQDALRIYFLIFGDIYKIIHSEFTIHELKRFFKISYGILTYSNSPFYMSDSDCISPLQESILEIIGQFDLNFSNVPAVILENFADYITLAFTKKQMDEKLKGIYGSVEQQILIKEANSSNKLINEEIVGISTSKKSYSTVTYIAFSKTVMQLVNDLFKTYVNDQIIYLERVFKKIMKAYSVPMKLKYNCPLSGKYDNNTVLWKVASIAFLDVVNHGLCALDRIGDAISEECIVSIWEQILDVLHNTLTPKSKPPPSIQVEQLNVDESFDIKFLSELQTRVLIHLGHSRVPQSLIYNVIKVIYEGSKLYYSETDKQTIWNESIDENFPLSDDLEIQCCNQMLKNIDSVPISIIPLERERFAFACLQCLFELCSDEKNDYFDIRQRIAKVAAPILLKRCAFVIYNYTIDQSLFGKIPFLRIRNDELSFVLRKLIELRFRKNILYFNKNSTTSLLKKHFLSGQNAHLFYLHPVISEAVCLKDSNIGDLLKECLRKVGEELGVYRINIRYI
ncbi:endosomal peripheral membrane protein [Gigaspora margarita]|uniref:Endosomal peripheral membrane protein n=1 Tax=Gigaspora margarita TaxID=4874 RepID=A0A8H4EUA7_GIGMA|nr:endosomal peripheral membrane protein [Gigaspora margarita]